MSEQPLPLEDILASYYTKFDPDPNFVYRLEAELRVFMSDPKNQQPEQRRLPASANQGLRLLAWIAAALIILLLFTWAFNRLLPRQVPSKFEDSTATATYSAESPTPKPTQKQSAVSSSPRNAILYTVKEGDTLATIAEESGMPVEILIALNNLEAGMVLMPGTELIIGFATPTPAPIAQGELTMIPLTRESSSDEIRQCLQRSPGTWNTLWADALITTSSKGETHVDREQVWLTTENSRWMTGAVGENPSLLWIGKEGTSALIDLESGEIQEMEIVGRIPSQLENLLLPAPIAARGGEFQPLKNETIAGRESLIANWMDNENNLSERYWIDVEHCTILKWLHLSREYPTASGETIPSEIVINSIDFDKPFDETLFENFEPLPQAFAEDYQNP